MSYLLDTHTFIWAIVQPKKLPSKVLAVLRVPSNEIALSAVSIWEAAIKLRSGKLDLQGKTATDLLNEARAMNLRLLDLTADEAARHISLTENTHFDPFDRMLIWQAISRNLTLVSGDREFKKFKKDGLKILWK